MKKKQIALLLAALLCVSPVAESMAVMGAEFSSGEDSEAQNAEKETLLEETADEAVDIDEPENTEEIWTSGEEEAAEFETGEEEQQDAFVEEADVQTEPATTAQGTGTYEVAFINEGQFNTCLRTDEDRPDVEMQTMEKTTLTNALNSMEGDNTGYCLVVPHDLEDEEDIVVPEGMNVFVGYGDGDVKIRSITPNGNITFWGVGNDKESIEIKEGKGTVTFKQLHMNGEIKGTGADDTVTFVDDAMIGGISGIENVHFDCWNLNIKGKSEFYNLYNDTGHDEQYSPAWIQIEGYSKEKVPVFHKAFDWGAGTFENEEGDSWTGNYSLGISYVKSFEEDDWQDVKLSSGSQAVTFDMSLEDAVELSNRLYVSQNSYDCELSLDGKIWDRNENRLYRIYRYQDAGDKTAQEIFDNNGLGDFDYPDGADILITGAADISQVTETLEADAQKENSSGYYIIDMPKDAKIDTISIPAGVKGVTFWGPYQYNEETDTRVQFPVKIGTVQTQEGQIITLSDQIMNSGLKVTGNGTVRIQNCVINGTVEGTGADDTVVFQLDSVVGGLQGVENVHFGRQCDNLNLTGTAEFYNIYNENESPEDDMFPIELQIEGKENPGSVIFHKPFDLGTGDFVNEEGISWTDSYKMSIRYFETFETYGDDWEMIDVGEGYQSVVFDMPDTDIVDMLQRVEIHAPENGYRPDMNGKTWMQNESNAVDIKRCKDNEGMTAQEIFEAYGTSEVPDNSLLWLVALPDTAQAERYMKAYQQKKPGEGYYIVQMGKDAMIQEELSVPDTVQAVKYVGPETYDEETETDEQYPIHISSVKVSDWKKISLMNMLVNTDTLTVSGNGTTELLNSRVNGRVTADTLKINVAAAVLNLTCRNLDASDANRLVVGEYLKFEQSTWNPELVVYAQPGSYLELGEIENSYPEIQEYSQIILGNDGKSAAQVYFGGDLNLGSCQWDVGEYPRQLLVLQFDAARAKKAGVPVSKDCFAPDYRYDWGEEEANSWWDYHWYYQGEESCMASVNSSLDAEKLFARINLQTTFDTEDGEKNAVVQPRFLYQNDYPGLSQGMEGSKRRAFYVDWWSTEGEAKAVEIQAYFAFTDVPAEDLSYGQISEIKDQIYKGSSVEPSITVALNGKKLKENTDYTVAYANNKKAGVTATVSVTGMGAYRGTLIKNFKITAVPQKDQVYTLGDLKYKITKSAYKNGTVSVCGTSQKTVTAVSIPATVRLDGYTFKVTAVENKTFKDCLKLKKAVIGINVQDIGKEAFSGCTHLSKIEIRSKVVKYIGSSSLKGISSKAVIYVPASKCAAYQKLLKNRGQRSTVKIVKKAESLSGAVIAAIKDQIYAGKAVCPTVIVTLDGSRLKAGSDYTVTYSNNKKSGAKATVTVKGKGNYTGTVTGSFKIAAVPAKGKTYTAGGLKYKVIKSAYQGGTVCITAPEKKTLTSATVPASVKLDGYAFNVTAISDKAFSDCTKLKKVTIGKNITQIGKQAFSGCRILKSIVIQAQGVKSVGSQALKGISKNAVIKVPSAMLKTYQKLFKGKGQNGSVKITK